MLQQARRAAQTVTSEWVPVRDVGIAGVTLREVKNVVIRNGVVTELFRPEWFDPPQPVGHVTFVTLLPGRMTAWHCHRAQNDIIFTVRGHLRIGLYDDRPDSPTYRASMVLHASPLRPGYVTVPAGVWHAVKNLSDGDSAYVVLSDVPYRYEEPDDWIIPEGSDAIPVSLD